MRKHKPWLQNQELTQKELADYRQWLSKLDSEARETNGDLSDVDYEIWQYFDPETTIGKQIYESYSDEELLSFVLATMDHPGHKPRLEQIYVIYRQYLKLRFNSMNNVIARAKTRRKQLAEEAKWPPDWVDRISLDPIVEHCKIRGQQLDENERELLQKLCKNIKKCGYPPLEAELSPKVKEFFRRNCGSWQKGLKMMNIPVLNKRARKHLIKFWAQERAKQGGEKHETNV